MRDFTITQYNALLQVLLKQGFQLKTFCGVVESATREFAILRNAFDDLPNHSLHGAKIQTDLGTQRHFCLQAVH